MDEAAAVAQFVSITECDSLDVARTFLHLCGGDMDAAVTAYLLDRQGRVVSGSVVGGGDVGGVAGGTHAAGGTDAGGHEGVGGGSGRVEPHGGGVGGVGGVLDGLTAVQREGVSTFKASTGEGDAMAIKFLELTGWEVRDGIALYYADKASSSTAPAISEAEISRMKANAKQFQSLTGVGHETAVSYLHQTDFEVGRAVELFFNSGGAPKAPKRERRIAAEVADPIVTWSMIGETSQYSHDNGRSACTTIAAQALDTLLHHAMLAPALLLEAPEAASLDKIVTDGVLKYSMARAGAGPVTGPEHASFAEVLAVQDDLRERLKIAGSVIEGQTGERDPFLQVFEAAQLLCPADAHIGIVLTKTPETIALVVSGSAAVDPIFLAFDSHPRGPLGFTGCSLVRFPTLEDMRLHLRRLFPPQDLGDVAQEFFYNAYEANCVIWTPSEDTPTESVPESSAAVHDVATTVGSVASEEAAKTTGEIAFRALQSAPAAAGPTTEPSAEQASVDMLAAAKDGNDLSAGGEAKEDAAGIDSVSAERTPGRQLRDRDEVDDLQPLRIANLIAGDGDGEDRLTDHALSPMTRETLDITGLLVNDITKMRLGSFHSTASAESVGSPGYLARYGSSSSIDNSMWLPSPAARPGGPGQDGGSSGPLKRTDSGDHEPPLLHRVTSDEDSLLSLGDASTSAAAPQASAADPPVPPES